MPLGLRRYQREGDDHFITFSCFRREAYFATPDSKENSPILWSSPDAATASRFGYVVMPEHVHLLVSEPLDYGVPLSKALQALKISVSRRFATRPFWQRRYYDFNVFSHNKRIEKLKYMHRNPVKRGLVERPDEWRWSSYRHYLLDEAGPVEITRL